jgi:hypothetical protein
MTDGNTAWETASTQPDRPSRGTFWAGTAVAMVILATVGGVSGWVIAGNEADRTGTNANGGYPASTPVSPTPTSSRNKPTTAGQPSATRPPAGTFAMPDLVGKDFTEAREILKSHKLGWNFYFGNDGDDRSVKSTDPEAGTPVKKGKTVKVHVAGEAPEVDVPTLVGLTCSKAGDQVVDLGLDPRYPTGTKGNVVRQDPEPGDTARWNEKIHIWCGTAQDGASSTPVP